MNDNALAKLDAAKIALSECKTVMETKQIADMAEAARVYLERTNASTETVNRATEIRLLAERQMGEFLKHMPKNTGTAGQLVGPGMIGAKREQAPTLKEIGLTHSDSFRAQKLADIPADEFHERIEEAKEAGRLSTSAILKKTNRVKTMFSFPVWKSQTKSLIISWLQGMPEEHRPEAASYLGETAKKALEILNK